MKFQLDSSQSVIVYGGTVSNDPNPPDIFESFSKEIKDKIEEEEDTHHGFCVEDLTPVKYWLCSIGSNNNLDYWGLPEMSYAAPTIAYKPININHTRRKDGAPAILIGVNYASSVEVNPETGIESVLARAVLYTYLFGGLKVFQDICDDIEKGESFASMECVFSEFYAVNPQTGEDLEWIKSEKDFSKALKAGTAARKFGNPLFIGSAFLKGKPPADPAASIHIDDVQIYSLKENGITYFLPIEQDEDGKCKDKDDDKKEEKAEWNTALDLHKQAHVAYNALVKYGAFSDWTIAKAINVHESVATELSDSIGHETPLVVQGNPTLVTVPMIARWAENSQVTDVFASGELETSEVTANTASLYVTGEESMQALQENIPKPYKEKVEVSETSTIKDLRRITPIDPYEEIHAHLSNLRTRLKNEYEIGYNNSDEVDALHFLMAIGLHSLGINCSVASGDIPTLGMVGVTWVQVQDRAFRVTDKEIQGFQMAESEHSFDATNVYDPSDIEVIRDILLRTCGNKYLDILDSLLSMSSVSMQSDIPVPQVESLFSMSMNQSVWEGDYYLWHKGDPIVAWKVGTSYGMYSKAGTMDISEHPQIREKLASITKDVVVEGFLTSEGAFTVYDVLVLGELLTSSPYANRHQLLATLPFDIVDIVQSSGTDMVDFIRDDNRHIIRAADSTYNGEGYYEFVPAWIFSTRILEKTEHGYLIGNEVATGSLITVETMGRESQGDGDLTISCKWITPNQDGTFTLHDLELVGG